MRDDFFFGYFLGFFLGSAILIMVMEASFINKCRSDKVIYNFLFIKNKIKCEVLND